MGELVNPKRMTLGRKYEIIYRDKCREIRIIEIIGEYAKIQDVDTGRIFPKLRKITDLYRMK